MHLVAIMQINEQNRTFRVLENISHTLRCVDSASSASLLESKHTTACVQNKVFSSHHNRDLVVKYCTELLPTQVKPRSLAGVPLTTIRYFPPANTLSRLTELGCHQPETKESRGCSVLDLKPSESNWSCARAKRSCQPCCVCRHLRIFQPHSSMSSQIPFLRNRFAFGLTS